MFEMLSKTDLFSLFIGLYMASASLGLLIDRDGAKRMISEFIEISALGYLGGILAFLMGAVIVSLHNDWSSLQAGFVTLVGWAALIEGIMLLSFRKWFLGLFASWDFDAAWVGIVAAVMVLFGGFLMFSGLFV